MQLRRCFITIHAKHLDPDRYFRNHIVHDMGEEEWKIIMKQISDKVARDDSYEAGALALEMGEKLGRIHIQGYLEHKPKRLQTLANDLGVMKTCFDIDKDAKGSWYARLTYIIKSSKSKVLNFENINITFLNG